MTRRLLGLAACCAALALITPDVAAAATFARGHGQIVDPAPPEGDFYSFSFNVKGSGTGAQGPFSLSNPSRGFTMTGSADCLLVTGDDAVVSGTITSQQGVGPGSGGVGD